MSDRLEKSALLRKAMLANAAFSTISGLVFVLFAEEIAVFEGLGTSAAGLVTEVGILLFVFASFLVFAVNRFKTKSRALFISGEIAVALDVLWVIGTVIVIVFDMPAMTVGGQWAAIIVALLVLDFAVFQFIGLKRMYKSGLGILKTQPVAG